MFKVGDSLLCNVKTNVGIRLGKTDVIKYINPDGKVYFEGYNNGFYTLPFLAMNFSRVNTKPFNKEDWM